MWVILRAPAWERTVFEALASRILGSNDATAGGACNSVGSQAEPGNQMVAISEECRYSDSFWNMTLIVLDVSVVLELRKRYLRTRMRISYQAEARLFVKAGLLRTIRTSDSMSFFLFHRSLMIGICVCGVLPFATSFAQQVPDAAFKANVEKPAYTDKHPKVLFDEAHFNVHTMQGTYKAFVDLMSSDGYEFAANDRQFDAKVLSGFELLIISNARGAAQRSEKPAFTDTECDAVRDWIQAGGGLLLVVDHYPTGHAAENLAKRFNIELSKGTTMDRANAPSGGGMGGAILFSRDNKLLGDHFITRGRKESERVNRVVTFTGQSLKGPPESVSLLNLSDTAVDMVLSDTSGNSAPGPRRRQAPGQTVAPQVSAAGRSQGVAMKFGKGRVVVLGEASQLSAQRAGPGQQAMGMNYSDCDNRQWGVNIMHWLSGLME